MTEVDAIIEKLLAVRGTRQSSNMQVKRVGGWVGGWVACIGRGEALMINPLFHPHPTHPPTHLPTHSYRWS